MGKTFVLASCIVICVSTGPETTPHPRRASLGLSPAKTHRATRCVSGKRARYRARQRRV